MSAPVVDLAEVAERLVLVDAGDESRKLPGREREKDAGLVEVAERLVPADAGAQKPGDRVPAKAKRAQNADDDTVDGSRAAERAGEVAAAARRQTEAAGHPDREEAAGDPGSADGMDDSRRSRGRERVTTGIGPFGWPRTGGTVRDPPPPLLLLPRHRRRGRRRQGLRDQRRAPEPRPRPPIRGQRRRREVTRSRCRLSFSSLLVFII